MIGQKCPDVTLYDTENIAFNLSESDHSYTVLYFWDIECGHCAFYTPVIYNVYKRLKNEDIKFIAVYTEDNYENWLKFLKENSIEEWTNLYDPTGNMKLVTRFDLYKTPRVFILDKDKKIISNNIEIEEIEKYLINLSNGKN
jgi:thiol-disulfide isomerase/thioredoxin